VLILDGNALIVERKLHSKKYSSLIIFFPAKRAADFIRLRSVESNSAGHKQAFSEKNTFLKFNKTPYITEYVNGLMRLIDKQLIVPEFLLQHKLEEAFLTLMEIIPNQFLAMFRPVTVIKQGFLRQIVENNLLNNLTLNELAFLANRSLATFKRDFEKEYGVSPGKYIRERKLEIARYELINGNSPAEIFMQLGYENVSNFTGAFKKKFGQTPKAYQQQKLN
jgi:AraC-like DNA-binding protein